MTHSYITGDSLNVVSTAVDYFDYAVWQKDLITSEFYKVQKKYWLDLFNNEVPILTLPKDISNNESKKKSTSFHCIHINQKFADKIRSFCLAKRVSISSLFLLVYYIILSKYSNQSDIAIGTIFNSRTIEKKKLKDMLGLIANRIALRINRLG